MSTMKQRKQGNLKNEDWTKPSFSSLDENGEKKDDESSWFWKDRNVFIFCLAFRVFNSLLVQTYFAPDEHWQCLEVAHRMVFGYGHLTWEWEKGIRSYLHPMIFAVLYKILAVLGLDTVLLMRGSEAVMFYLAKEAENHQVESVIFLTQCHATPYYSQLHQNISMRFLDCTPRDELVTNQSKDQYQDESDRFFKDPVGFASHIFSSERLPTHVVLFDSEAAQLKEVLASYGYVMVKKIFHSHFPVDRHLQGYVLVYRKAY